MKSNEDKARELSQNKSRLRRRILEAKSCLKDEYRKRFTHGEHRWDLDNHRLISDDGQLALQWKLRNKPDEPESYHNQQTSVGTVQLETVDVHLDRLIYDEANPRPTGDGPVSLPSISDWCQW